MADKRNSAADDSTQVFRQFAWHLAGSLAGARPAPPGKGAATRPAKATGRR